MATVKGCFKPFCLGCLGIILVVIVIIGVGAISAKRGLDSQRIEDREFVASVDESASPTPASLLGPGHVILDLAQGEFQIRPAPEGEGLSVKAHFDQEAYEISHAFEVAPDSAWTYHVVYHRTISGLQAALRAIFGDGNDSVVEVFLPRGVPITLEARLKEGGGEADLGGLWLTDAGIVFDKGGLELDFSEPLHEPMGRLSIRGFMGGVEASRLGNASPHRLEVECKMGGVNISLTGGWANDCDAVLGVNMGGMNVLVPEELLVDGFPVEGGDPGGLRQADTEIPLPTVHVTATATRGEIVFTRQ